MARLRHLLIVQDVIMRRSAAKNAAQFSHLGDSFSLISHVTHTNVTFQMNSAYLKSLANK